MRVLAADGQPLYRDALARAIGGRPELELVGEAGDGRQALDAISASAPDVALIGSTLDGLSGEQVLNAVARDRLATRVVMMAARPEPSEVYAALADGAAGYLTKDADARELCDAVARGGTVLSLIAEGLSAPDIGRALHLSTATVKTHLRHIYEKLGVSERAAAVAEAMRRGLLE